MSPSLPSMPPARATRLADGVRRAWDVAAATLVLLLGTPLLAAIALWIRRDSAGPIVFSQWRLGKDCRPFRFYKFRTMYVDWPRRFPEMIGFDFDPRALDEVYLQFEDDPRTTRLGRFLRRTSLDELPNLWNILRGEMTLVGPRPELPDMLPYYQTREKFNVKPGLTCWAQILGRGQLNFPDTVRLDVKYVRERSLLVDVKILLATIRAVFDGRGAY